MVDLLSDRIADLHAGIAALIAEDRPLRRQPEPSTAVPGIAPVVRATLLGQGPNAAACGAGGSTRLRGSRPTPTTMERGVAHAMSGVAAARCATPFTVPHARRRGASRRHNKAGGTA